MESIEQTFNGTADFGRKVTATVSRNGDLVCGMWLEMDVKVATAAADYGLGNAMIKTAELEIGGQLIDRHYGEWMSIWGELSTPAGKLAGYDTMVGNTGADAGPSANNNVKLDVPLQFWFCRNPGLALPLIALQYHEVKLNIEFRAAADLDGAGGNSVVSLSSGNYIKLYVDYVYLDTDERRRFAQISHEYLIEQVQHTGDESVSNNTDAKMTLNFNHPCKELVWVIRDTDTANEHTLQFDNSFTNGKLQLNGHDRFSERRADYFLNVQNYKHHTRVPRYSSATGGARLQKIYTYSFALQPEEHQPSGTCNFSRIDNAVLTLTSVSMTGSSGVCKVFAVNYNVLRIMSGMGGLAYSN